MPLAEQLYCTQQINIPPTLPTILKQFCKAAIRTQPYDLLKWSSTYFRALADGEEPPIKLRLEYPPPSTESGLTLGFLKVLLRQFGDYNKSLTIESITRRWDGLCLDHKDLELIMSVGEFHNKCQVKKFLSIGVGLLGNSLHETMIMICELFTHEPEGGSAMIPLKLFMEIYSYLAALQCDGADEISFNVHSSEIMKQDNESSSIESRHKDSEDDSGKSDIAAPVVLEKLETKSDLKPKEGKRKPSLSRHLKVPGIGPYLTSEHVATVSIWLSECARLQEGMVGPRNLRHFQCPSLDYPELQPKK
ncbi:ropporin-1-like protein isoform X1 [Neodiprion pinetum]|uniref:ropporin-1-like protein isoform X1 n=1 Tax=Neodiprion pinetum TaxID=441929 RepID=UPI001EDD7E2D|nr:ropporin-1-like protein isoform X1 [Neodiprion pinetum]